MRILLLGADGQVGHELCGPLATIGELAALRRADCDVTDSEALAAALRAGRPNLIVNATAYNAVDRAEDEAEIATAVNEKAVAQLGELALELRAGLIHMSTDYVFDGKTTRPYREDDPTAPLSVYASSKLAGEKALRDLGAPALVFRTSWVFSRRPCFLSRMLRLAEEREELSVAHDQMSCPTFARDLAAAIAMVAYGFRHGPHAALTEHQGVYHLCGSGVASRWELVREAIARDPRPSKVEAIHPVPASTFPTKAERPHYSAMDCTLAAERFGVRLPHWRDGVRRLFAP
jgi:dTDP-4-dehydrorhamnose reductase